MSLDALKRGRNAFSESEREARIWALKGITRKRKLHPQVQTAAAYES